MELSVAFLASQLKKSYPVALRSAEGYFRQIDNPRHVLDAPKFKTARLYRSDKSVEEHPGILVIVREGDFAEDELAHAAETMRGLVWIGNTEPPRGVDVLWISTQAEPVRVLDSVLDVFERFNEWDDEVGSMLLAHRPVEDVVATLAEVTSSPFWYSDSSLHVNYMSKSEKLEQQSEKWRYQTETGRYPSKVINKLVATGDLDRFNMQAHAWLVGVSDNSTYDLPFVSKAIFLKGGVFGYIFIIEREPGNVALDIELAEKLGNLIALYVQHGLPSSPAGKRYTDQLLRSCLAGDMVSAEERGELLNLLGWTDAENFMVVLFDRQDARHGNEEAPDIQVDQIAQHFPEARAFAYDVYIVLVTDVGDAKDQGLFLQNVEATCKDLGWKAGTSTAFSDFARVDSSYGQAQIALRKGLALRPDDDVYRYERYLMSYVCQKLAGGVGRPFLMHPDVERLIAHDEANDSELLKTLEAYLDNERNVSATAKSLYLHRNSVVYRIDKIGSLVESDLGDPENRLAIQFSIALWRYERAHLEN